MSNIGTYLRRKREAQKISLRTMGGRGAGYHFTYLSKIENGMMPVTAEMVRFYARELHFSRLETNRLLLELGVIPPEIVKYFQSHVGEFEEIWQRCA